MLRMVSIIILFAKKGDAIVNEIITPADRLRSIVKSAQKQLQGIDESAASSRPAEDKWSVKEVIGHLIDSACNNHGRFVRAQGRSDLLFDGYQQEHWVRSQRYQSAPWTGLVALWSAYNLHLAWVMEGIPESELLRPREPHSLDSIAWKIHHKDEPVTLDFLIRDYVDHLEHHLQQIEVAR